MRHYVYKKSVLVTYEQSSKRQGLNYHIYFGNIIYPVIDKINKIK